MTARAGASDRVPADYAASRAARPDLTVLAEAGFLIHGRREFRAVHTWTPDTLIGMLYSTSVLSRAAVGGHSADFERDVRRTLTAFGPFVQQVSFACDLAARSA